jgi:hypothetical protein
MWNGSSAAISNNTIDAGGGTNISTAVYCSDSAPSFNGNTFDGGTANFTRCLVLSMSATPTVNGNKFDTSGGGTNVGLMESDDDDEPEYFTNNEFVSAFDTRYQDFSGGSSHEFNDIADINNLDENGYNPPDSVYGNF